ncbi:cell division protein FtsQ/DivIB [Granulicoccus phenolivorans]|uniref:cell division protein FtsQ/DivIB n=1 Tax=Granulicoccus phenolivorans TaxID=266854 RepID=UPI0003FABDB8|nr:FtsQ-type POTRA domain-containing protein [Granulicoccus phenolivorans]
MTDRNTTRSRAARTRGVDPEDYRADPEEYEVTDATDRIAHRRRRRARRNGRRLLILILALVLIGAAVWLVGFSSVFALREVRVTGVHSLSADQVREVAAAPIGRPLARVSEREIADRVATLPQVAQVHVVRRPPNGIEVAVTERTALYAVAKDNQWWLVDAAGIPFQQVADRPGDVLAVNAPLDPALLGEVAQVIAGLDPALRGQTAGVAAQSTDSIVLTVTDPGAAADKGGKQVIFGNAKELPLKNQVALALLKSVPDAQVYDVSAPAYPSTRK